MSERTFDNEKFENLKLEEKTFERNEFIDCEFINCTFDTCKINFCKFNGCRFVKCTVISLKSEYSTAQFTEFENCNLIGVNWNKLLPSKRFAEPIKSLQNCRLKYNYFTRMNLTHFDFSDIEITDSMFSECTLTESSFKNCILNKTEFFQCDLKKADFRDASGYQIDVMTNKLKGARFSFPEVVNLLNSLELKID